MRLIFGLLALANLRWADADLARADRLRRESDAAQDAAEARLRLARGFASRAHALRA